MAFEYYGCDSAQRVLDEIGLIRIPGLVWDECFVSRESEAHAGEN